MVLSLDLQTSPSLLESPQTWAFPSENFLPNSSEQRKFSFQKKSLQGPWGCCCYTEGNPKNTQFTTLIGGMSMNFMYVHVQVFFGFKNIMIEDQPGTWRVHTSGFDLLRGHICMYLLQVYILYIMIEDHLGPWRMQVSRKTWPDLLWGCWPSKGLLKTGRVPTFCPFYFNTKYKYFS